VGAEAIELRTRPWDGTWYVAAVTLVGANAPTRADLRQRMTAQRFGELREGVWMRPANVIWTPDDVLAGSLEVMTATPQRHGPDLARQLFGIDERAKTADELRTALGAAEGLAERIAIAAAVVRHLVADPLLPTEMLPPDWPGHALREIY
jgi:phenylacetic acid degradation operon negative regulatory protein